MGDGGRQRDGGKSQPDGSPEVTWAGQAQRRGRGGQEAQEEGGIAGETREGDVEKAEAKSPTDNCGRVAGDMSMVDGVDVSVLVGFDEVDGSGGCFFSW